MAAPKRTKNLNTPEVTANYYLTNSKLLPAVIRAKEAGRVTDELAMMLMILTKKYSMKPCFSGYTYREDMVSEALANLCQNALKFNPEKSDNPFAFYTTCITNSFLHFLNIEKKHRKIRDQMLIDIGENPSYNFTNEVKNNQGEYQVELNDLTTQISEAKERLKREAELDKLKADNLASELAKLSESDIEEVEVTVEINSLLTFD